MYYVILLHNGKQDDTHYNDEQWAVEKHDICTRDVCQTFTLEAVNVK